MFGPSLAMTRQDVGRGRLPTPGWPDPLCRIPRDLRGGHRSICDLLIAAAPDLTDDHFVIDLVRMRLGDDPSLVDDWQIYSYDKRSSPAHTSTAPKSVSSTGRRRAVADLPTSC